MAEEELAESGHRAKAGLILAVEFERFPDLLETIRAAGCKVIFQKIGPPWAHLRIVEEEARR